jgi:biopolymer transport protein ExbD
MAVRKKPRARILLDMTPMVDIGFLLVIFFMSTYNARPPETVQLSLPISRSPFKVPESDVLIISILSPARSFGLAESINPGNMLSIINNYQMPTDQGGLGLKRNAAIALTVQDIKKPDKIQTAMTEAQTFTPEQLRARADSLMFWWNLGRDASQPINFDNLAPMIIQERTRNPRLRLVIKADKNVESGMILRLMTMLQDPNVNMLRFSMMTILEERGANTFMKKGG